MVQTYNIHIQKYALDKINIFSALLLSDYVVLTDKYGRVALFDIDDKPFVFCFNKSHLDLNLEGKNRGLSFFDKLRISGIFKKEYKWKTVVNISLQYLTARYTLLEPRNLFVDILDGEIGFSIYNGNKKISISEIKEYKR